VASAVFVAAVYVVDVPYPNWLRSDARHGQGRRVATTEDGTLLGRLRKAALDEDSQAVAEHIMEPGASTVRAPTRSPRA